MGSIRNEPTLTLTRMSETVNQRSSEFLDEFILIEDEPVRKGEEGMPVNSRLEQSLHEKPFEQLASLHWNWQQNLLISWEWSVQAASC